MHLYSSNTRMKQEVPISPNGSCDLRTTQRNSSSPTVRSPRDEHCRHSAAARSFVPRWMLARTANWKNHDPSIAQSRLGYAAVCREQTVSCSRRRIGELHRVRSLRARRRPGEVPANESEHRDAAGLLGPNRAGGRTVRFFARAWCDRSSPTPPVASGLFVVWYVEEQH